MRTKISMLKFIGLAALLIAVNSHAGDVVIVGDNTFDRLDSETIRKIFTGKVVEVDGIHVTPINNKPSELRNRFLKIFLGQDEEKYTAYWTVRRYIGKGVPPQELSSTVEIIKYVKSTPGAIAYMDESDVPSGMKIVAR